MFFIKFKRAGFLPQIQEFNSKTHTKIQSSRIKNRGLCEWFQALTLAFEGIPFSLSFLPHSLSDKYNSTQRKSKTNWHLIFSPSKHNLRIDRNPGYMAQIFPKLISTVASRLCEVLRKTQNTYSSKLLKPKNANGSI